jgi:hypothetical protein
MTELSLLNNGLQNWMKNPLGPFFDSQEAMLSFATLAYSSEQEIQDYFREREREFDTTVRVDFLQEGEHHGLSNVSLLILEVGEDDAVIAFRGTDSTEQLLFTDTDFQACYPDWLDAEQWPGCLHKGFSDALGCVWSKMWCRIDCWLQGRLQERRRLWLSGHSLGGALATITALRLECQYGLACHAIFTFGSPRVMSVDLSKCYTEKVAGTLPHGKARHFRFFTRGDPVTSLPPRKKLVMSLAGVASYLLVDYKHVGLKVSSPCVLSDIVSDIGLHADLYMMEKNISHHSLRAYAQLLCMLRSHNPESRISVSAPQAALSVFASVLSYNTFSHLYGLINNK